MNAVMLVDFVTRGKEYTIAEHQTGRFGGDFGTTKFVQ
jgi:hypothetical protein